MISVEEALSIIAASAPGKGGTNSARGGPGRVLARDVVSDTDWPPFETSAMDGYAVRMADRAAGDRPSRADGARRGGRRPSGPAPPRGGRPRHDRSAASRRNRGRDSRRARAARRGPSDFRDRTGAWAHIRRRGESIRQASRLICAGRRVTPRRHRAGGARRRRSLTVFIRPRVAVAATGNELVPAGEKPRPGQIRDSNGPMLVSLCRAGGWRRDGRAA